MASRHFEIRAQPGFGTIALFTFAALYLPIVTLVAYAFNASDSVTIWGGLSFKWFVEAWRNDAVQDAAMRSFIIAASAATAATIAATMAACVSRLGCPDCRPDARTFQDRLVFAPVKMHRPVIFGRRAAACVLREQPARRRWPSVS